MKDISIASTCFSKERVENIFFVLKCDRVWRNGFKSSSDFFIQILKVASYLVLCRKYNDFLCGLLKKRK